MSTEHNRLLLQIERAMRAINQATIKPVLPELTLDDLEPVISMVARTRVLYLQAMFDLANSCKDEIPTQDQIDHLASLRRSYEEQVAATQALETAVQRGYLDVHTE